VSEIKEVKVPDIGGATNVDVIEVLVSPGDEVAAEDSLITLEGDKATMEIPAPFAGKVKDIKVAVGDKVSAGSLILTLETAASAEKKSAEKKTEEKKSATPAKTETVAATSAPQKKEQVPAETKSVENDSEDIYAGPAVRRLAHELDLNLAQIKGTGPKGRILKEDLKAALRGGPAGGIGLNLAAAPEIDFAKYGPIETHSLNKIKKLTGVNVHRSWVTVPHVTQFDEADITEMEAFRQGQKKAADEAGIKLTPLVFIMKAVVAALKKFPTFNASLDNRGENLILKQYFHLGIAVETPNGLVVPVIRDVDQKSLFELAGELGEISKKAREKGLSVADMEGSCFTISSLGGIGGTAFTPIVKAPDVAILGVSKASMKPVYQTQTNQFIPRLMLPLSLSYDHRVIDGAEGARFTVYLASRLADIRTLLL
jgi:pyruvate dehydrogenase E2 component (dihydrolipoamide acetyltransferase)